MLAGSPHKCTEATVREHGFEIGTVDTASKRLATAKPLLTG
jgi:hypothetical protein